MRHATRCRAAPIAPPAHAPRPPDRRDAAGAPPSGDADPQRNFRFFDNRQKYLLFVNTC